jgi:metallo-beta-lactamase family protein
LPETTVIIVGYKQKELGEEIARRDKEVKIYGKYYPVEAKICEIEGLSAHADQRAAQLAFGIRK